MTHVPAPGRAAEIATDALVWLAAEPERISAFLGTTGADASDIRARAGDPEFLGFVLDFLTAGDEMLLAFCADGGHRPQEVIAARAALPGGDLPHWT